MRRTALLLVTVLVATCAQLVVAPAAVAATRTVTLTAVADTMARQQAATTASGTATSLLSDVEETAGAATRATSYLRFTLPTLAAGESITGANLSVLVTNGTANGPAIYRTATDWTESTLTWNSGQPARSSTTAVGNFGSMATGRIGTTVSGISGSGDVSFQLYADVTDGMAFASRENTTATNRPQLVLTIASGTTATAPTVPTSVTASSDTAGTGTLRWAAPTSDGGSAITGYRVSRDGTDSSGAGPWSGTVAATARSFTFTALTGGATYRLTVEAINAIGMGPAASATVTVSGSATRTVTLNPVADTMARQQAPTTASGAVTSLTSDSEETSGTTSRMTPYLRFTVPALAAGESITAANLGLQVTNATTNGPSIWRTSPTWTESTLTWNSGQPARSSTTAVGNYGSMATGRITTAVTGVTGAGDVSFQLYADVTDGMAFASRENTTATLRPQLVLTIAASTATAPNVPTSVATSNDAAATGTITWTPPTSDGGSPITSYRVARDGTDSLGAGPWSGTVSAATRSFTFSKLVPERIYSLTVQAINTVGSSGSVTRTVYVVPDAPRNTSYNPDAYGGPFAIKVDPSGSSFVLTAPAQWAAEPTQRRFYMAEGDKYIFGIDETLVRAAFVRELGVTLDYVRIEYPDYNGTPTFAASAPGPFRAPTGTWSGQWDDDGIDVDIDANGTSLVVSSYGYNPVRQNDEYIDVRVPMHAQSKYSFILKDHTAAGAETSYASINREEFASFVRESSYIRYAAISYDVTTGLGSFDVTGARGFSE